MLKLNKSECAEERKISMKAEKKARILESYKCHDTDDVSDERLLQMVADSIAYTYPRAWFRLRQ